MHPQGHTDPRTVPAACWPVAAPVGRHRRSLGFHLPVPRAGAHCDCLAVLRGEVVCAEHGSLLGHQSRWGEEAAPLHTQSAGTLDTSLRHS